MNEGLSNGTEWSASYSDDSSTTEQFQPKNNKSAGKAKWQW